jgi:arylsulfatase A-like enzyme
LKNIIWLITDTFRYDNLAGRAKRPVRTPELDRFAEERASSMEAFYVGSFPTIPQRTDLATGRTGWPHYGWQPIDLSSKNHIAAMLRDKGYVSQLICDCPHLFNARFQQQFHAAHHLRGQEGDMALLHLNDPIREVVPLHKTRVRPQFRGRPLVDSHRWMNRYPVCEADLFPARTAGTAIRWLEENYRAQPFFLWVDFFDPHEPWDPPEYLVRQVDPDYDGPAMLHPNYGPSSDYTPRELHNLWAHYATEAMLVDRWMGRVLQKIDDLGLWDDTLVLVLTDHGMSIGEHDRTGKSNIHPQDPRYWPIYPEIGHCPLLIAGGDVPRGKTCSAPSQPADVLPTLCDLAGLDLEPPEPWHGRSFADALLRGKPGSRDTVVSGCHLSMEGGRPRRATMPFVGAGRWGYAPVGAGGEPELYDLSADPWAEHNLAGDHAAEVKEMHERFVAELRAADAPDAWLRFWAAETGDGRGSWAVDYAEAR